MVIRDYKDNQSIQDTHIDYFICKTTVTHCDFYQLYFCYVIKWMLCNHCYDIQGL